MLRHPVPALLLAGLLVVVFAVAVAPHASTPAGGSHRRPAAAGRRHARTRTRVSATRPSSSATKPTAAAIRRRQLAACPGRRVAPQPQTLQLPSTATAAFRCEMRALWAGIRTGRLGPAMPAFFPLAAYVQVKAIVNPQADWLQRLVGEYALDLRAAHALLGAGAATARLVRIYVPPTFAHLVSLNVCSNRDKYWETPNSRLIYEEGGTLHSLGIASMISWRGYWFVVHLGAVLQGDTGVVDAPSSGAGVAVPSSTC